MPKRQVAFRRIFRNPRKFAQERHAYAHWTPRLGPWAPRLVRVEHHPPALVLTELAGQPLETMRLPATQTCEVHRCAGSILARLHAIPEPDEDPLSIENALILRARNLIKRAATTEVRQAARKAAEQLTHALMHCQPRGRVPCHRDFEPRNWLVELGPPLRVFVIDFEHARMDLALADLTRLRCLVWPERPDLEEAFFQGYGTRLDSTERTLLEALSRLDAVGTWIWGIRHHDRSFIERAHRMMNALIGEGPISENPCEKP